MIAQAKVPSKCSHAAKVRADKRAFERPSSVLGRTSVVARFYDSNNQVRQIPNELQAPNRRRVRKFSKWKL